MNNSECVLSVIVCRLVSKSDAAVKCCRRQWQCVNMSRLLSVLSAYVCGQNILQRTLNISERLAIIRFTQTQPVLTAHSTDPSISLFHRPTKTSIDISDTREKTEHATICCKCSGEVVDVYFNESLKESLHDVQQKIRNESFVDEALQVESVDELLHKEIKPTYEILSLASLYAKLSKLRLTGKSCAELLFVTSMFLKTL